jgi:hypothetical protein
VLGRGFGGLLLGYFFAFELVLRAGEWVSGEKLGRAVGVLAVLHRAGLHLLALCLVRRFREHTDDALCLCKLPGLLCDTHVGDDVQRTDGRRDGCTFTNIFWRRLPRVLQASTTRRRAIAILGMVATMVHRGRVWRRQRRQRRQDPLCPHFLPRPAPQRASRCPHCPAYTPCHCYCQLAHCCCSVSRSNCPTKFCLLCLFSPFPSLHAARCMPHAIEHTRRRQDSTGSHVSPAAPSSLQKPQTPEHSLSCHSFHTPHSFPHTPSAALCRYSSQLPLPDAILRHVPRPRESILPHSLPKSAPVRTQSWLDTLRSTRYSRPQLHSILQYAPLHEPSGPPSPRRTSYPRPASDRPA